MSQQEQTGEKQGAGHRLHALRRAGLFASLTGAFVTVTAMAVFAAYRFGEGIIYIDDRTVSQLSLYELTGGAALGIIAAVAGVGVALVGAIATLVTAIIGLSVGALGLAIGAIIVIGVVTGPLLLIGFIAMLIKRRYWPDVI